MNIGKTIQDLRKKQGLSGVVLAKKVGITQSNKQMFYAFKPTLERIFIDKDEQD